VRVVQTLMRHGVCRPEQNVQAVAGTKVYVLDLAWPQWKIAVELDGFDPHGILRSTFDHDRDRDLRLRRAGWEVIHVSTNTDLRLLAAYLLERMAGATGRGGRSR
jgi:very-short-patch-repair endonuclease